MKKLNVTAISKKKIKHIYVKNVTKQNYLFSFVAFILIFASCLMLKSVNGINDYAYKCFQIYSPINTLFNESGGIIFTNSSLEQLNKKNLKFITPIKSSVVNVNNGELCFNVDVSIMVLSPEDGIVKEIGVLPNGEKYIEIMHNKNTVSRIENIYITGVVPNQVVSKGKDIATTRIGDIVRFSIYVDGIKQSNIKLEKNDVVWENLQ